MSVYGYVRAQAGQNIKRQIRALTAIINREDVFIDRGESAAYAELKERLQAGDLLIVKSLDQLGNNYEGILREWEHLTEVIGADVQVLDLPLIDTRKRNEGIPVSGIVQQILGFAAEKEKARTTLQAQGIRKAKERGVRFGRPRFEYSAEFIAAAEAFRKKQITLRQALERTGIKKSSFYYHLKRLVELGLVSA